ncbi:hypothetical protein M8C21_030705 [Ambrosia artemisiifolia]|uniref:Signal peptidase complex subunit 3 n=1 Tax=Ambrosia artemisiifolia TaxID=4212 RepID=A0AAD5GZC8_AMBAR|nr:hypothetical protein M8C21_030705 [Ambrosia artemisiifolia]
MHSFGYRANALLTFSLTILALMCAIASLSDNFNSPSPTASVQILNVNRFQKRSNGDDEVAITLEISADLQSLFTWNTKQGNLSSSSSSSSSTRFFPGFLQVFAFLAAEYSTPKNSLNQVSLWDRIIPTKEDAKFSTKVKNKYKFIDQGSNLRGRDFNMTLHWHVMPKTGKMFADKLVLPGFRLPESYSSYR